VEVFPYGGVIVRKVRGMWSGSPCLRDNSPPPERTGCTYLVFRGPFQDTAFAVRKRDEIFCRARLLASPHRASFEVVICLRHPRRTGFFYPFYPILANFFTPWYRRPGGTSSCVPTRFPKPQRSVRKEMTPCLNRTSPPCFSFPPLFSTSSASPSFSGGCD